MLQMSKFGDWVKAGVVLQGIKDNLKPNFEVELREDGELILKKIREHVAKQDLDWVPLSPETVYKKGSEEIYVETGFLMDNLEVRKVKSSSTNFTLFIGASAWKKTKDDIKLSDLMIWLEYGTDKIPPRPLIRPTWDEVKPIIKDHWGDILKGIVEGVMK